MNGDGNFKVRCVKWNGKHFTEGNIYNGDKYKLYGNADEYIDLGEYGFSALKHGAFKGQFELILTPEERIAQLESELSQLKADIEKEKAEQEKAKQPQYPMWNFVEHMKDFVDGKIAVNCPTQESVEKFFNGLRNLKFTGWNGKEGFSLYKENTCYCNKWGLGYFNITYYLENGLKIVVFE